MSAVAICAITAALLGTVAFAEVAFPEPSAPLDEIYRKYYETWPALQYCVATADVFQRAPAVGGRGRQRAIAGCTPPPAATTNSLFWIDSDTYATVFAPWASSTSDAAVDAATNLERVLPTADDAPRGVGLVIENRAVNVSLLVDALRVYRASTGHGKVTVNLIVIRIDQMDDRSMFAGWPAAAISPYETPHNWTLPGTTEGMWKELCDMTVLAVPDDEVSWRKLVAHARVNRKEMLASSPPSAAITPAFAAETSYPMFITKFQPTDAEVEQADLQQRLLPTCLTQSTPSCLPIGGQSVLASTRRRLPSLIDEDMTHPEPQQRSILIVVSSSTTAFMHEAVPGANAAASGIVGALAIAEALAQLSRTYLRTSAIFASDDEQVSWSPTQVAFLFATGDDYGLAGSGRFVRDLFQGVGFCTELPSPGATDGMSCKIPWTKSTNFTSMRLEDFTHVIELSHLAVPVQTSRPVFVHVDRVHRTTDAFAVPPQYNFANCPAQQRFIAGLQDSGATGSSVPQLPPGPLFAFLGIIMSKNARINTSAARGWDQRWSGEHQPSVLGAISRFDVHLDSSTMSSTDRPADFNGTSIADSIAPVLALIEDVLFTEYQQFLADPGPSGFVLSNASALQRNLSRSDFVLSVSTSRVDELWNCFAVNLACPYVTKTLQLGGLRSPHAPNYYPGVFGFLDIKSAEQTVLYYMSLDIFEDPSDPVTGTCGQCPLHTDCVRNRCVTQHAWYHHSIAPALDFVREGFVYFKQNGTTQDIPRNGVGALQFGLSPNVVEHVWVESFWNNLGARTVTVASAKTTAWIPAVGCVTVTVTVIAELLRRRVAASLVA